MADGGRAEKQSIEEIAARQLARVMGYGDPWRAIEQIPDDDNLERDRLTVKTLTGQEITGTAAIPTWRPNYNVMAALSFAKLTKAEQALLLVYAGAFEHWPDVEAHMIRRGYSRVAAADGMNRILWSRPDVSIGERAKSLGMQKARYGAQVRAAQQTLSNMLRESAARMLAALNGNQLHPQPATLKDKDDLRRPVIVPPPPCRSIHGDNLVAVCGSAWTDACSRGRTEYPGQRGRS